MIDVVGVARRNIGLDDQLPAVGDDLHQRLAGRDDAADREDAQADDLARHRGTDSGSLQLLADGMSNADVAKKLFISQETVKSHVRHILAKLEADTRTHAVAIALRDAIID